MRAALALSSLSLLLVSASAQAFDPFPTDIPRLLISSIYSDLGIPTAAAAQVSFEEHLATDPAAYASFQSRAYSVISSLEYEVTGAAFNQPSSVAAGLTSGAMSLTSAAISQASAAGSSLTSAAEASSAAASSAAASTGAAAASGNNAAPTLGLGLSGMAVAGLVGAVAFL